MHNDHVVYILNTGNTIQLLGEATQHFKQPITVTFAQQTITLIEQVIPYDQAHPQDRMNKKNIRKVFPQRINGRWVMPAPSNDIAFIHEKLVDEDVTIELPGWEFDLTKDKAQRILFFMLKEMLSSLAQGVEHVSYVEEIASILMDTREPDRFDIAMAEMFLATDPCKMAIDDTMAILNMVFKESYREWRLLYEFGQYVLVGGFDYRLKQWSELTQKPLVEESDFVFDIKRLVSYIHEQGISKGHRVLSHEDVLPFLIMRSLRLAMSYTQVRVPACHTLVGCHPATREQIKKDIEKAYAEIVLPVVTAFVNTVINDDITPSISSRMVASIETPSHQTGPSWNLRFTEQDDAIGNVDEREQVLADLEEQHYVPRAIRERYGLS